MNYKEICQEYLAYAKRRGVVESTLGRYSRYLKIFGDFIGDLPIELISRKHVEDFQDYLLNVRKVCSNTRNYYLIALRSMLSWCYLEDVQIIMPHKVELAKKEEGKRDYLTEEEINKLMRVLKDRTYKHVRDKAILMVLFSSGIRVGELVSLNVDDIKPHKLEFSIIGKGKKPRPAFITEEARKALDEYLATRDDDFSPLFINFRSRYPKENHEHRRLTKTGVEDLVRFYARRAGLKKKITPHSLRHTFATTMLESGMDIYYVSKMMGHTHVSTTEIYLHSTNKKLQTLHQEAFDRFNLKLKESV